jgi:DNA-binding NarL/FixJ family response regulator
VEKLPCKVIVYTGYIDAVDVTKARLSGADGYEVKTQDCAKLLDAVKKLISGGTLK